MSTHAAVQKRQHDETSPQVGRVGKPSPATSVGLPLFMQTNAAATTLQRQCACASSSSANDECASCNSGLPLQAKLTIGASDDPLEQEADRVAEQVLAMPANPAVSAAPPRIQRYAAQASEGTGTAPASVDRVLASSGSPLEPALQQDMSQRFGHNFSRVRVHSDSAAEQSAKDVNAHAYTVGHKLVFGTGQFAPETHVGRRLLAHELTHVVQQTGEGGTRNSLRVARLCTPIATCGAPIPGSAEDFGTGEQAIEAVAQTSRRSMTPARAVSTGHAGRARQLERFLTSQDPSRLANIKGIFIHHDMSPGTGALTQNCVAWISENLPASAPTPPGMAGAGECTFVHGQMNQEALIFNNSTTPTIGRRSREQWRIRTLQALTHETEHPRFETATAGAPSPPGVTTATCSRANVLRELSEIAAGLSEFTPIFRPASAESSPAGPLHTRMANWFHEIAITGGESFHGALTKMGCSCDCPEIDAHVQATFTEVTASNAWSVAERAAFNTQMRLELPVGTPPSWPL